MRVDDAYAQLLAFQEQIDSQVKSQADEIKQLKSEPGGMLNPRLPDCILRLQAAKKKSQEVQRAVEAYGPDHCSTIDNLVIGLSPPSFIH